MNYRLIIRKRAENHLTTAFDWYQEQRTGLGSEFLLSIESTLLLIERSPLLFQVRHKNIRAVIIPRFPYGVFYFVDQDKIVVIAVFHLSRNPKLWMR